MCVNSNTLVSRGGGPWTWHNHGRVPRAVAEAVVHSSTVSLALGNTGSSGSSGQEYAMPDGQAGGGYPSTAGVEQAEPLFHSSESLISGGGTRSSMADTAKALHLRESNDNGYSVQGIIDSICSRSIATLVL